MALFSISRLIIGCIHLAAVPLLQEVADLSTRGLVDALIVSGNVTGKATELVDLTAVKEHFPLPVLFPPADGFIVGSYFKEGWQAKRSVEAKQVTALMKLKAHLLSTQPSYNAEL